MSDSSGYVKIMTINKSGGNSFIDSSIVEDGTYQYKIQVNNNGDKFGGSFSDVFPITIDTTPPEIPNISVNSDRTNNSSPTWSWNSISDAVKFHIILKKKSPDEQDIYESDNYADTSFTHDTELSDGTYELSIASIDSVGNKSEFALKTIEIDTTPPSLPTLQEPSSPTNNKNQLGHGILILMYPNTE